MVNNQKEANLKIVSVIIPTLNRATEVADCINSVLQSEYQDLEIIVVDNASADNTVNLINDNFSSNSKIKLIRSKTNLGAAGGRNLGAKQASGEYLLFVDSDNIIDNRAITNLVSFFEKNSDCGMVGPLMLYKDDPNTIWLSFADINMVTSQAKYRGTGEKRSKELPEIIEVGHLPNCFMVSREDFERVNKFDERYFIMYEEADLAARIKKILGKKIFLYSPALVYHNVHLPNKDQPVNFGFNSAYRAYLTARNRVYFMKKNASWLQFLVFSLIFNPLIFLYYEFMLLKRGDFKKAWAYANGNFVGFLKMPKIQTQNISAELEFFDRIAAEHGGMDTISEEAYEIIFNKIKPYLRGSLLEAGCGSGPFGLKIKQNFLNISITGVDINKKFIDLAERTGVYNKLICANLENKDIFFSNSFEVIICPYTVHHFPDISQVINNFFYWLKPGGYLLLIEPNGSNLVLRLSYWLRIILSKFINIKTWASVNESHKSVSELTANLNNFKICSIDSFALQARRKARLSLLNPISILAFIQKILLEFYQYCPFVKFGGSDLIIIAKKNE
ncbi:MAG: glycosyltransferase [Candidatus Falkowbacteria bacterium]|nr:glycosyltransferase [Candidatus Falkowbacteria bacterium]